MGRFGTVSKPPLYVMISQIYLRTPLERFGAVKKTIEILKQHVVVESANDETLLLCFFLFDLFFLCDAIVSWVKIYSARSLVRVFESEDAHRLTLG